MTREQIAAELATIERVLAARVQVWRVIIDPDTGKEIKRIYAGSFVPTKEKSHD